MTTKTLQELHDGQEHRCVRCREKLDLQDAVVGQVSLSLGSKHGTPSTVLVCRACAAKVAIKKTAPICEGCGDRTGIVASFWVCQQERCANQGMRLRPATPEEIEDHGWCS